MILGVVLVVLGNTAIVFLSAITIADKMVFGWIFLISDIAQIIHAFSTQRWRAYISDLLIGALYFIARSWLAFFPLVGIIMLAVFLAVMFTLEGGRTIAMALSMRDHQGRVLLLISGLVALAVGTLIFAQLPRSATSAIGLLVGINMISSRSTYVLLALAADTTA